MKLTIAIIGVGLFQLVYHQDMTLLLKILTVKGVGYRNSVRTILPLQPVTLGVQVHENNAKYV